MIEALKKAFLAGYVEGWDDSSVVHTTGTGNSNEERAWNEYLASLEPFFSDDDDDEPREDIFPIGVEPWEDGRVSLTAAQRCACSWCKKWPELAEPRG